jgi:hypothetical protein
LRDRLTQQAHATLLVDLAPGRSVERLAKDSGAAGWKISLSNRLRKGAGLEGVKAALVRELGAQAILNDPAHSPALIKALPIPVTRPRPIAEAISSAGGIRFGCARRTIHAENPARRLCCRRNAGLGSADRGLSAHSLFCHRTSGGRGINEWLASRLNHAQVQFERFVWRNGIWSINSNKRLPAPPRPSGI